MTLDEAEVILGGWIGADGGLSDMNCPEGDERTSRYVDWSPGRREITLDSFFSVEELESMAVWMRAHQQEFK